MRNFIFNFVVLFCASMAYAHPNSTDDITSVGIGSQIILKSDLNIKPNINYDSISANGDLGENGPVKCIFSVDLVTEYDRSISGSLTVTGTTTSFDVFSQKNQPALLLRTAKGTAVMMTCLENSFRSDTSWIVSLSENRTASIGAVKARLDSYVEIKLADPRAL